MIYDDYIIIMRSYYDDLYSYIISYAFPCARADLKYTYLLAYIHVCIYHNTFQSKYCIYSVTWSNILEACMIFVNLSGVETVMCRKLFNTMFADALTPGTGRPSAEQYTSFGTDYGMITGP